MSATRERFEPWAWAAFALAGSTAGLFAFLGFRTGGAAPVLAYRFGLIVAGWLSAVAMALALAWSLRRRPVLQRGRAWPLAALGLSLWFCSLPIAYPSSHEGKYSPTRFRLPFEGGARVRYGGEHALGNPLVFDPARRFGTAFEKRGAEPLVVSAPADGTLVERRTQGSLEVLALATGAREYCVLAGLAPGTCALAPGSAVRAGARLGTAELLFVHLQDRPAPGDGEGIPMRFWNYVVDGRAAEAGVPVPPQEVAAQAAADAGGPGR